jgi:hypothetical protein
MRIEGRSGAQEEDRGPLTPWKEAGSRGLDTWFESPVGYAIADGSGGEPGTSYNYSLLVEDYLATLSDGEANEGYCAWLKDMLTRVKVRKEG